MAHSGPKTAFWAQNGTLRPKNCIFGGNGILGEKLHFWRKMAHLGPECTSMEFIRKCRSERLLCQKIKLFLQKTPSAREGRDRRNFRRKCDFLPARLPKSSEFLDPDSGPILTRFCTSAKSAGNAAKPAEKRRNGI